VRCPAKSTRSRGAVENHDPELGGEDLTVEERLAMGGRCRLLKLLASTYVERARGEA
jgi:hypothetical protein